MWIFASLLLFQTRCSTPTTFVSGRASAAESLQLQEMVMAAYRTLLETDESPSDSNIVWKTFEMFPSLQATFNNLKHRVTRVRKYHPDLSVVESVWLESCHHRWICTEATVVEDFREQFPDSSVSDAIITQALERFGPQIARARPHRDGENAQVLGIYREVFEAFKSAQGGVIDPESVVEQVGLRHSVMPLNDLMGVWKDIEKYARTTMSLEEGFFFTKNRKRRDMTLQRAKQMFRRAFPDHIHSDKEIEDAYCEIIDNACLSEEKRVQLKELRRNESKQFAGAAEVRRKIFEVYRKVSRDGKDEMRPADVLSELSRKYPEVIDSTSNHLYAVIAEVRKYPPELTLDESIQLARWARRRPDHTFLNLAYVLARFRIAFPESTASDEMVSKAFTRFINK